MTDQDRRRTPDRRQTWRDRRRAQPASPGTVTFPQTQAGLRRWVRQELRLPADREQALLGAIDAMVTRQEQLWERSKTDAIEALTAAFRNRLTHLQKELAARDATVANITEYFEQLISDLSVRASRDPKTQLMNFSRFQEQLEASLTSEQRGRWYAVGLVDVNSFKWYNDTLGHAVGDRILQAVAALLRERVRSDDLVAHESQPPPDLHARFGGDEFCFLIQGLDDCPLAALIADRFIEAVRQHDWRTIDERLQAKPVRVDVGVACLRLGPVAPRRRLAPQLGRDLLLHADRLMYRAKHDRARHAYVAAFDTDDNGLVPVTESLPEPAQGGTGA